MTGEIVPVVGLAYEDIRHEVNGAISLIGLIHAGEVAPGSFPYRQRLGVALIANITKAGELTVTAKLHFDGALKWSNQLEIEFLEEGDGVLIPLGVTYASFEKPGKLELSLEIGGVETAIHSWVIADSTVDDHRQANELIE